MARRSSTAAFERVITLNLARFKPPEQQRQHAAIARRGLAEHLARQTSKPAVKTIVDGRVGASEDSVRPYGVIRYEFSYLREIAEAALLRAREMSPEVSGDYKRAWFLMVGDAALSGPEAVPDDATEVILTNDQPYHRKLHVKGGIKLPPGIVEALRAEMVRRFGNVAAFRAPFIRLEGGYRLKRAYTQPGRYTSDRRSRVAGGMEMTYPSLSMSLR